MHRKTFQKRGSARITMWKQRSEKRFRDILEKIEVWQLFQSSEACVLPKNDIIWDTCLHMYLRKILDTELKTARDKNSMIHK